MPAFKNHIAALHDIFIHFFHCRVLLQLSSREFSGKEWVFFFSRAIEKGRAFASALLAGINLNLLYHRSHSWKCWELPSPELAQVGPKVGSSVFSVVSVSLTWCFSQVRFMSTVVRPLRAAD